MKLLKKSLACLLSVMLLLSCIPLSAAAAATTIEVRAYTSLDGSTSGYELVVKDIDTANSETLADAFDLGSAWVATRGGDNDDILKLTVESAAELDLTSDLDYIYDPAGTIALGTGNTYFPNLESIDLSAATLATGSTTIPDGQFESNAALVEISLPTDITAIGLDAFKDCTALETVNFSSLVNLVTIGTNAFEATALVNVDLSSTKLTVIPDYAFYDCAELETITFGSLGLTSIGDSAFEDCILLESIDLSQISNTGNINLGALAFSGCTALTVVDLSGTAYGNAAGLTVFGSSTTTSHPVTVIVPAGTDATKTTLAKYEADTNWGTDSSGVVPGGMVDLGYVVFSTMSAPQNVDATAIGDFTVNLKWQDPAYTGGSTVAFYEFSFDSGTTWGNSSPIASLTKTMTSSGVVYEKDLSNIPAWVTLGNYYAVNVSVRAIDSTGLVVSPAVEVEVMLVPTNAEEPEIDTTTTGATVLGNDSYVQGNPPDSLGVTKTVNPLQVTIAEPANIAKGIAVGSAGATIAGDDYYQADFGSLTYQWYYDTNSDCDPASATAVPVTGSATTPSGGPYVYTITPDVNLPVGTYYYFLAVTNNNPLAYASDTTVTVSNYAKIIIQSASASEIPTIITQPEGATYVLNETSVPLVVEASVTDGGTLYYEWYKSKDVLSSSGFNLMSTGNTYTSAAYGGPETDEYGTFYYFVDISNNNPTYTEQGLAESNIVTVYVKPEFPVVSGPSNVSYKTGDTASPLTVSVDPLTDGGTLSYQWYVNSTNSTTGGVAISGETNDTYTPDISASGLLYYYVEVTNTNTDAVGTIATATTTSDVATVSVDGTDAETPVLGTAVYGDVVITGTTATLEAPAVSGVTTGTISYQWYSCDADGSNAAPISGENGATYDPDTSVAGTYYYYVEVTNTDTTATGLQTVSVNSEVYTLTVVDPQADAETPVIDTDPADAEYETGETPDDLYIDVVAFTSPTVSLSYEWFSCDADGSNANLVGTGATYTPDTSAAGEYYYYVVITNTDSTATVNKTASATSGIAKITVTDPVPGVDAEEPVITTEPESAKYDVDDASVEALTVEANVTDGGTLSYQWYTCDADGTNSAPITGANSASYTPDVSAEGTTYYYVVVTNTNTSATGSQTAETKSEIVSVVVEDGYVAPVEYTVTFMDGEDELTDLAATVEEGEKVAKPADPEKEGYTFTGWYTEEDLTEAYDFDEPVTADLVLYAGWEAESTTHKPYVAGYDDGTFRPNASITRAEAAQMFYNLLGNPDPDDVDGEDKTFPDVNYDKDSWYADAVTVLAKMEVIKGDTDGKFRPTDAISRAEFASMVQLFYKLADGDPTKMSFTDVGSSHWARTAIAAVYEAGYVVGTDKDGKTFEPNINISRAMVVSILNKAQNRISNEAMWDDVKIPFSDVTTAHWGWTDIMEAAVEHEHPAATETETEAEE